MATFVNDLRLKEIATGDEDGVWGVSTNTNLALIADAFSLGTKNMAANADETFTMPDATADGTRSLYLKITSAVALTATRTVTLGPNTVSKVWIIENATTGSQSIIIAQGSGATVTVATGTKAMIVTDGAGAGAAVALAGPSISTLTGTLPVANGGTSLTTLTANNVILGNGASAPTFVAPSTSGNVLTSNGTTWASTTPAFSGTVTSVAATVPTFLSVAGSPITTSGTLAITLSGTALPVTSGGIGATTLTANYALLGNGASAPQMVAPGAIGNVLTSDGTTWASSPSLAGGTVSSVAATVPAFLSVSGSPITAAGTLAIALSGTALPVSSGGTSLTTLTANNVILGNGASTPTFVAPSTSGNVLTSNGTTWTSVAVTGGYSAILVTVSGQFALDGTLRQVASLSRSVTYRFDQSAASNAGHPLRLSLTPDGTHGGGVEFTTGVTVAGTPGSAGAYTQVTLEQDAPVQLYYYCSVHSGMGAGINAAPGFSNGKAYFFAGF